jgi:glycosyltransferase involved in cell wall biosynthesis
MAAGRAVISTDVGGVKDLFGSQKKPYMAASNLWFFDQGILVQSKDFKGFACAMNILLKDDRLRMEMGAKGRQRAWPNFDISRLVRDTGSLYEELT